MLYLSLINFLFITFFSFSKSFIFKNINKNIVNINSEKKNYNPFARKYYEQLAQKKNYIVVYIQSKLSIIKDYNDLFMSYPKIDYLEWHPYTVINTNQDNVLKFIIHKVGKWTTKFHNVSDYLSDSIYLSNHNINSLSYSQLYNYIVLFFTGISISTFETLLLNYINFPNICKNKKIYIIWITNDYELLNEYKHIFNKLSKINEIFVQIYFTIKFKSNSDQVIIQKIYQLLNDDTNIANYDILNIGNSHIRFCRPKFKKLFKFILFDSNNIYFDNKLNTISLFYSGLPSVKKIIKHKIRKYNYNTTKLHYRFYNI